MKLFSFFIALLVMSSTSTFKSKQLTHKKVEQAHSKKYKNVQAFLEDCEIGVKALQFYLRAFKEESELEMWGKEKASDQFTLLKTYMICYSSGGAGPKRKQSDLQVPEGFYRINRFNPESKYHLSLGINYPNASDKVLGDALRPGGDIFIHGSCVSAGCPAITDDTIKDSYIYCVEARNNGSEIPVTIFPFRPTEENLEYHKGGFPELKECFWLWGDLRKYYKAFNKTKTLQSVTFNLDGSHSFRQEN